MIGDIMKSRMDKYYNDEEVMQRTTRHDYLYDELYKEKQVLNSNVTVLDNINEIDISKIKAMVEKRENYSRVKDYNKLLGNNENKTEEIKYDFEEVDSSNYYINEILKKKRIDNNYDKDKVRKLSNNDYEDMKSLENTAITNHEKQLRDLFDTVANAKIDSDDLFSNLKEDNKEVEEKEETFYTSTSKFDTDDFNEEENNNHTVFIVIAVIAIIIAVSVVLYLKIFK